MQAIKHLHDKSLKLFNVKLTFIIILENILFHFTKLFYASYEILQM